MDENHMTKAMADAELRAAKAAHDAATIEQADAIVDEPAPTDLAETYQDLETMTNAYLIMRDRYRALMHEGAVLIAHKPKALIWSNEHQMWWRAERSGYTPLIEEAGRYDMVAAIDIVNDSNVDGKLIFHRRGSGGALVETLNEHVVLAPECAIELVRSDG